MKKNKIALITGVTGQDGAYLSEFLLDKGYEVHGIKRRSSTFNTARIDSLHKRSKNEKLPFFIHHGDMIDGSSLHVLVNRILPDEVYNLAAQSHVSVSFEQPEYTTQVNAIGVLKLLEAIKAVSKKKQIKFYQASTSELFGRSKQFPQDENTPFYPRSPYGLSKLYAYWLVVNYREAYDMFACNGILFNHESPFRGKTFVTRKITNGLAKIKLGLQDKIILGNLNAKRDWGHAKDYVEMQWLMLQQEKPEDFIISSGVQHSVRDFINVACQTIGFKIFWEGEGINEKGYIFKKNKKIPIIEVSDKYFRPTEVDSLVGNCSKAKSVLGWRPKITFEELIKEMVEYDLKIIKNSKIDC